MNIKLPFPLGTLAITAILFVFGCSSTSEHDHPPQDVVLFGGEFVEVDNPNITLTVADGKFRQGGQDIYMSGTYHAHRIDDSTYKLHVTYEGKFEGVTETLLFRREDQNYLIGDADGGEMTRFKRKQ